MIKFLLKKKQTQNHHKIFHFSCLHTTLHLHLLPNPQCTTWAAITLCFSRQMPRSDKWDSKWYQAAGTQKDQTAQSLLYNVKRHWSKYLCGFLLHHFCQKAWPPEVWHGRIGTLGIWDFTLYDPPIFQTNWDFSPLSGEHTPTPLRIVCIFLGTDHMSFILLWNTSVASKQSTTGLTRMKTKLLRVLHSDKAPPHPHQPKQDTACKTQLKNPFPWKMSRLDVELFLKTGPGSKIKVK